ncbi:MULTISPECIES: long-chain fatty acid--CoA ligase [unclassified Streptomyces]|uniref:AMP-dependent synthetase/ligase n=1 Tax=unclassified Streptomyces TaxID=2593676 RepID=UPI002DDB79BE|nr:MULTISPECIES: long-chain fatty acid--CoA ligase [unclassified Streptomyces]WSA91465.1 long-chain fatty acid--CoA ligase [Streptomyces sp. NBC_01795]WSB75837.1 long-chain fatty acid--CoA ligase [Streptomyces sp. NBC_01775]WSS15887.1 long-chain fatty acid--CoA ligase [Streptomyces sp. NBC_01186]WSS44727.1 long-chain fatty acid--CoA ligase [Streptomyces sp. NBC_01187]
MREFTVPALATEPQVGGLADVVFEYADESPALAVLARKDERGEWQDVSAAQFRDEVVALAKGLLAEGVRFGDRVALMSRTRYEWTLLDFALWAIGAQSVPVYPTSSAEQVAWMLHDAEVSAAIVEHEDHAMTVGSVIDGLPRLKRLWQLNSGALAELTAAGAHIEDEVVHRHRLALTPDTVATVIYTSGTTGRPKGCVITHANFMAEADNIVARYDQVFNAKSGEQGSLLLFLPLAHVFGRMVEIAALRGRVKLGHQPDMSARALMPDLKSFRPTFVQAVPHLFEKIFRGARRKAEAEGRLGPFDKAVDLAIRYAEATERKAFGTGPGPGPSLRVQHQVYDRLVYTKLREAMGGRCRYAMSGGSAMERRLGLFFDGAGMRIFEGYGLTESTAAAVANPPERPRFGTVGQPVPGTSVRIAEDGEILLHGGQIFDGYLNNPRASQESLREGWLTTGDLGSLDDDGYLTITGRKKEILVTSGGKSVSPGPLEDRVREHPLVGQCIVLGNDRPYVSALLTLDQDSVQHWLTMRDKPEMRASDLLQDADLETEMRRAVVAANTQVSQAESIRTFRILAAPFTEEQGLLTPSLKLKRAAIESAYAAEIEALYRG